MSNQNTNEKFEILKDESIKYNGRTLYRIRALRDIGEHVKKGDLGGFIQHEFNLSRYRESWVFPEAKVYDNGLLARDATASGLAEIFENAKVGSRAYISDNAKIYGNADIHGLSVVDNAQVYGDAYLGTYGFAKNDSRVHGTAALSLWGEGVYGEEDVASREEFLAVQKLRYSRWAEFLEDQNRRQQLRWGR